MELAFETVALRRVCESDVEARKRFPLATVDELQARLADVRAARSVSDLVAGQPSFDPHPPGRIRFILDGRFELVCASNHPKPPLTDGDFIDFGRVRRLKVVAITEERSNG